MRRLRKALLSPLIVLAMYNYLIYSQLKKYTKADKSFHMPGHKARGDFKSRFPVAPIDVTELPYSDNLLCPTGVIARAQKDIAEILGANKSYILTDGSSSGILAAIFAISKSGNKLIVPRNSHVSIWNACKLYGLEPVIVQGEYENGVLQPPAAALIEKLVSGDKTIAGMVVTSPDYYGNIAPLKEYSDILKKYDRKLIVDGAHGAHLAYEISRKGYAGVYADVWVDGVHKSLPCLTQGAVLSVNNEKLIPLVEEGLAIFRTTSPSFPIMAAVEYAVKYIKNNTKLITDAKEALKAFKEKCPLKIYPSADWTKLAIDFEPLGISSDDAAAILEKKGIYAELSDGKYLLFYLSPMITSGDMSKLLTALNGIVNNKKLKKSYRAKPPLPANDRTYSFQYALKQKRELIELKSAAGRMCARTAGIAPPCTPVVIAGEIITPAVINVFTGAKNVFGLVDGKIWVVKK